MKKLWLPIGLVLLLAVVALVGCTQGPTVGAPANLQLSTNSQQEGIWVSGTGKVTVTPNVASLSIGVESQEATVTDAQAKAAAAMDKIMAALTGNGVDKKDIKTQNFNIQRVTRWDDSRQQEYTIGYRVTNTVIAKIRDMQKVGAIIDAAVVAGGDLSRVKSIGFSVEDPTAYYTEARQKAMADAKAKATQLADLGGVKLGKPTYISESAQTPPIVYADRAMAGSAPAPVVTPISPGEMDIVLNVQITYAILN